MKRQTILITGASGLIGSNFLRFFPTKKNSDRDLEFVDRSLSGKLVCPPHNQMDISSSKQVKNFFEKYKPNVVIHFAAYRDATSAELERGNQDGLVWKSNVTGVKNLAKLCSETGCYFIHISTDMVFSGRKNNPGPYSESAPTEENIKRLSWYGWTKKLGEDTVKKSGKNYAIIRIGNVTIPAYDPKLDYIGKLVWLYNNSSLYPLFKDQEITLTYVPDLARVIKSLLRKKKKGIFHVATKDLVSPFILAQYLVKSLSGDRSQIKESSIDDYLKEFPNRYPKYGGLSTKKTEKMLQVKFTDWKEIADNFIKYMKLMNLN